MKRFDILTLFPDVVKQYLAISILGTAQDKKLLEPHIWNIRDFTNDKHRTVDDTSYGGGAGMVMKVEPIDNALTAVKTESGMKNPRKTSPRGEQESRKVIVLSARGKQFTQQKAQEYAKLDQLILICGRYEGIDQRVADHLADEELSVGPYVLAGGELAALIVIEAVARLIPGVLGNPESLAEESYTQPRTTLGLPAGQAGAGRSASQIEYPQYTKPEDYKGWKVPQVLLSGHHEEIRVWRQEQQKRSNW